MVRIDVTDAETVVPADGVKGTFLGVENLNSLLKSPREALFRAAALSK